MSDGGISAIVPVKPLLVAKGRLAGVLAPAARRRLVLTMLDDVLAALVDTGRIAQILVVTADAEVAARAGRRGMRVVAEQRAEGLNAGVASGLSAVAAAGGRTALVLPADLPLASAAEIGQLLDGCRPSLQRPSLAMVPAADGDGTNALLVSPPQAFAPSYGPGSFLTHLAQALARKVDVQVLHLSGIAHDIDRPQDLARLMSLDRYAFLRDPLQAGTTKAHP